MSLTSHISCRILTEISELEGIRDDWKALLGRSETNEPTLSPEWLLNWWRVFGSLDGRELRAALFYQGSRLVGLAPLLRRRHLYRGHLPFQRLEVLGTGEDEVDEVCSDYTTVIAESGLERAIAESLAAALTNGAFGDWNELVFPLADGDKPVCEMLVAALRRAGASAEIDQVGEASYIQLPASWEAYVASLSSSSRYYVTRSEREFANWAGKDFELRKGDSYSEVEEGKRILLELHRDRWSEKGAEGVFASEPFRAFHDLVLPDLLASASLDLSWLIARGEPIAAMYNIRWNGKIYSYQCGRKLDVPRGIRPGAMLHIHAIKDAIRAGMREYDFLAGSSQFKSKVATGRRPLVQIRAARKSLVETARSVEEHAIVRARALRRRLSDWRQTRQQPVQPAATIEAVKQPVPDGNLTVN